MQNGLELWLKAPVTCIWGAALLKGLTTSARAWATARAPARKLGAPHAGCFSMALALQLSNAGFTVKRIHTTAKVHFEERDGGWSIHRIDLETAASVSDVGAAAFEEQAQSAKKNSPVSRALSGVDIHLVAKLL
jgi:lipoyl-dependent peroxiredoxin